MLAITEVDTYIDGYVPLVNERLSLEFSDR
jgi:hypothetical protein